MIDVLNTVQVANYHTETTTADMSSNDAHFGGIRVDGV